MGTMTNPPTEQELTEMERLDKTATPGPWRVDNTLRSGRDGGRHSYREGVPVAFSFWISKILGFSDGPRGEYLANGEFIAAARTGWPRVIAEVRRLHLSARDSERLINEVN